MRRDWFFLVLVIVLGACLRLDILIANNFVIDADEAIVGLMAKHIIEGKGIPTFYYGQHYMGSLESLCVAVLFFIFGSSAVALKLVPFFFSLVLIWLVYALTFNAAGRNAARIAALLCAIPPSALVIWSGMARGGFIEIVFIGAIAFLLLQRWLQSEDTALGQVAKIGITLGLGWWVNNQILYFMIPIALVMLGRIIWWKGLWPLEKLITLFKVAGVGLLSWFVGSAPYWIYNIQNDWASLGMFEPAKSTLVLKYIGGFFHTALPILSGGARFWQIDNVFPGSKTIVGLLYLTFFSVFLILRWRQLLSILILKFDQKSCLELFFLLLISCGAIFVSSSFGWLAQAPRYLLPMYIGIFVLSGFVLSALIEKSRLVGHTLLSLLLFCNLASTYWGGRTIPGEPVVYHGGRVAKDHSQLITWLRSHQIKWVRTNYWIGYRLAFETNEEVRFIINQEPNQTRIPEWPKAARGLKIEEMPLVMVPSQARLIRQALRLLKYDYKEEVLSGYHVFYELKIPNEDVAPLGKELITVSSQLNQENVTQAVDGLEDTRWGSGTPQSPGMEFIVTLKQPTQLRAIRYDLGLWPQDSPRGLQITLEKPNGETLALFDSGGWEAIQYFLQMESKLTFYLPTVEVSRIILTQTKAHPIFDWSIAEIEILK